MGGFYSPNVDADGDGKVKPKATRSGWKFRGEMIAFKTATGESLHRRDRDGNGVADGTDIGDTTIKFYDASGNELTETAGLISGCVKTVVEWEPTHDYEIRGGIMSLGSVSPDFGDAIVWVTAIPDIPVGMGGNIDFIPGGFDLSFMSVDSRFDLDGEGPIALAYDAVLHTNKFQLTCKHQANQQLALQFMMKTYRV